jgi:hypothetical protein
MRAAKGRCSGIDDPVNSRKSLPLSATLSTVFDVIPHRPAPRFNPTKTARLR